MYTYNVHAILPWKGVVQRMGVSEAQKRASLKYRSLHLKRVPLDLAIDKYEQVKAHAESREETVNGFIKRAIDETMERDNE